MFSAKKLIEKTVYKYLIVMKSLSNPLITSSVPNRDIELAYQQRDSDHSRFLHNLSNKEVEEYHKTPGSEFVKSIIFGGLDGIVTTFAIISSSHASHLGYYQVLVLGLSNVLADAISMGHGDYFSEQAEFDYITDQYKREKWEMDNYEEGEITEMIELYVNKHNIERDDANTIIRTMAKYKDFFVDHMMVIELDLMPPDEQSMAIKNGLVTFTSFLFFGVIPILFYCFLYSFLYACLSSIFLLGFLGYIKASFTNSSKIKSCFMTILNGSFSAGLAYLVSWGLDKLLLH